MISFTEIGKNTINSEWIESDSNVRGYTCTNEDGKHERCGRTIHQNHQRFTKQKSSTFGRKLNLLSLQITIQSATHP